MRPYDSDCPRIVRLRFEDKRPVFYAMIGFLFLWNYAMVSIHTLTATGIHSFIPQPHIAGQ